MLKKYLYTAVAGLALMGCTSDDVIEPIVYIPGDSEVKIALQSTNSPMDVGVTPIGSRAAIETDDDLEGLELRVFCLARAKQQENEAIPEIDWTTSTGCLMNNISAIMNADPENSGTFNLTWNYNAQYYYPLSQFYAYSFCAYAPPKGMTTVQAETDRIIVPHIIAGTNDVIWGKAEKTDVTNAYSASYFRAGGAEVPNLTLNHMLTRLKFQAKIGDRGNGAVQPTEMRIVSVAVLDVAKNVNLIITRSAEPEQNGALIADLEEVDKQTSLTLKDVDGTTPASVDIKEESVVEGYIPFGESLMLMPANTFKLRVTLGKQNDDTFKNVTTDVDLVLSGGKTFEAGKTYVITLTINGLEDVKMNAKLNHWETVEDSNLEQTLG